MLFASDCMEEKINILMDYLDQIEYHLFIIDEDSVGLAETFIDFGILKQKSFILESEEDDYE